MKIAAGLTVEIEYELKVKGGAVIESSAKSGPLRYVHGRGKMLPGLERRLDGLSAGDEKKGEIPATEAFGTEESLPVKVMTRREFPPGINVAPGAVFEAKSATGDTVRLKVIEVNGDAVKARLVHPLAGRDIEFKVKVLAVAEPQRPPPPPGVVELDADEIQET
jgi:FKBP-type peptidyl-prolyl cis-trans isomerase SlyD